MKLKDINEIKEDGLVVFMPSGIQATLFNEGENILVKYYNLTEDKYTHEDFYKLINEGIFVFNDRPNSQVIETLQKYYAIVDLDDNIIACPFTSEDKAYQYAQELQDEEDLDLDAISIKELDRKDLEFTDKELDDMNEDRNEDIFDCLIDYADERGLNVSDLEVEDASDIAEHISDELGINVSVEEIEQMIEDEIADMEELRKELEDEDDMDESILDKLSKKGFIRESLSKQYENKMDEAFENVKNPQGNVFKAMQGREKHYLTPEFKLEMLQNLDKIQKQFPDMHIRQQAQTFMNELTMQEYYDIKVIQKFIDNYVDIMNPKNESLKLKEGKKREVLTDDEYAKFILAYMYNDPTYEEVLNMLPMINDDLFLEEIKTIKRPKLKTIYNKAVQLKKQQNECLKEDKEEDLNKLQKLQDKEAENIPNGSKEMYNLNKKYGKLRKKVHKHYAKNENVVTMAEDIRNGNKSGEDPEFGAWLLETSVDEKWEQLTEAMQMYLLDGIADYVQQGSLKEEDLVLEIDPESGLTKEDVLSLDMFSDEEIDTTYKGHDLQLHAFISYEIKSDKQAGNDKQEAFKLKKKKNKKQKIEDSINEALYLKDKDGNEVGPFKDQDAEEDYIKDQKKNGYQGEFEEVIKENKKEENMSKKKMTENCYKVYNALEPDAQPACFNSWDEIDNYLNQTWGEYKVDMAKKTDGFGTQQDYDNYLSNFEVAIEPIEIPVDQIPAEGIELQITDECPHCVDCDCDTEIIEEPAEEPMDMEAEQEIEDEIEEDELDEDFEDEHIGKSEEEPVEEPSDEPAEDEEIDNPKDALTSIENVEDAIDNIEDYIKTLLGDEDIEEVEEMDEMCMQKLPENATEKAYNYLKDCMAAGGYKTIEELKAQYSLDDMEQDFGKIEDEEVKKAAQNILNSTNEDFKDNMGMLTDINDLDFPDALADAVDTKEDGSLYRISDVAKEIEDLKATVEQLKNDFKSELTTMIQDLKNDLKLSVNNVETKVQDTKTAVDNLTSEEEDLADYDMEEPAEEPEAPAEEEQPAEGEEGMEEAYDEEALKGNKMFEAIKQVISTNKTKAISIPTIAERLREEYGIDANLNTSYGKVIYQQVANLVNRTSLKESVVDPTVEAAEKRKSLLGKAANWIGGGLMSRLQESAERQKWETLEQIKQEIDKKVQQGADAEELKDTITLASENEEESKQAKDYAINKLKTSQKVESLKDKLLGTSKTATFKDLNLRG